MEAVNWPSVKHMKISILLMQFDSKKNFFICYSSIYFIDILAIDLLSTVSRIKPLCCMYFCGVEKIQAVNQKISIMFTMIKRTGGNMYHQFMTWRWENNDIQERNTRSDFLKINALTINHYWSFWANYQSILISTSIVCIWDVIG